MPKQSKDVQAESLAPPANSRESNPTPPRKRASKAASQKPRAKKSAGGRARPKLARKPQNAPAAGPTDEQIRLRAYYLAERRAQFSLPGDSNSDWIEARRQLLEEAGLPPH